MAFRLGLILGGPIPSGYEPSGYARVCQVTASAQNAIFGWGGIHTSGPVTDGVAHSSPLLSSGFKPELSGDCSLFVACVGRLHLCRHVSLLARFDVINVCGSPDVCGALCELHQLTLGGSIIQTPYLLGMLVATESKDSAELS